jgi:tetratricopeptide (TPR) repeat protein
LLQAISPNYPKSYLVQAASLLSLNKSSEALESIEKELKLRNHPEAYHVQSLIYRKLADSANEQASLENVLRSNIKGRITFQIDYACNRLTALSIAKNDCQRIRAIFEELIREFPDNPAVPRNLAAVYMCLGEEDKARELTSKQKK